MRRLRHRPWPINGQEMRPVQHALLWPACQKKHWEEGGHDKLCKLIKKSRRRRAIQCQITKYTEAVAVAAEACAEDTKGQTCYICTQALHWKTKEGLVRMCVPRDGGLRACVVLGGAGEDSGEEAEENNLDMEGEECEVEAVAHVQPVRARCTTASCGARSGGRAGRRTWGGRRGLGSGQVAISQLGNGLSIRATQRTRCP